jgi:hypothetical protein
MAHCHGCGKALEIKLPVGRKDACPSCGADLRCCLNCAHHAPGSYNDCREPQAERVLEKGRSNFCDHFRFRDGAPGPARPGAGSARSRLDDLFK